MSENEDVPIPPTFQPEDLRTDFGHKTINSSINDEDLKRVSLKKVPEKLKHHFSLQEIIDLKTKLELGIPKTGKLDCYEYIDGDWRVRKNKPEPVFIEKLSLLTLNTWFSPHEFDVRIEEQIRILKREKPSVVGLQECKLPYLEKICSNKFIQSEYVISDNYKNVLTFVGYGVLLLVRKNLSNAIESFGQLALLSHMKRSVVYCNLLLKNKKETFRMNIATTHLESMGINASYRRIQLRMINKDLHKDLENAVLMGDFNLDDKALVKIDSIVPENENDYLTKSGGDWTNFVDCWTHICKERNCTIDTEKNLMIGSKESGYNNFKRRIDRIMVKSKKYSPRLIKLIGDKACEGKKNVFPSDHFGLYCEMKLL